MDRKAEALLAREKVIGLRQVMRGFRDGRIRCVLVAADAEEHIKLELEKHCVANGVKLVSVPSKHELGQAAGIDVDCAVVGIIG